MLNNYHYFIVLAEEKSISKAARRLFISHQCLSKYLKNLEQKYAVTLFERKPEFKLTVAGELFLNTLQQVRFLEQNLGSQLEDIRNSKRGYIRLGTTGGRYRILIPTLFAKFKEMYPEVKLEVACASTNLLLDRIQKNELDLALVSLSNVQQSPFDTQTLLHEKMFVVITDSMLQTYFPDRYPACKEQFRKGVDLMEFLHVPFVMNVRGTSSRELLERFMFTRDVRLNFQAELSPADVHYRMTACDYAASICLSMFVPTVQQLCKDQPESKLNIFPLINEGLQNHVVLVTAKGKILPAYGKDLAELLAKKCGEFDSLQLQVADGN